MQFRALKEFDNTQGSVQLLEGTSHHHHPHSGNTDIVLIPEPSNDPNDPLRWPRWKKVVPFVLVNFFAFMGSWAIGGLSQAFVELSIEFNEPIAKIANLLSYCILTLGLGNFFWVPMAIYLGKRPVFVAASLIFFVGCIWSSVATSYNSLLASRIVTAFAGGSTEALGAAIVNDLFFLHERGKMMGWCLILLSSGNSLGPIVAGFMVSAVGWRWFYWLCTIISGIVFVAVVLFVAETRFDRVLIMPEPEPNALDVTEKQSATDDLDKSTQVTATATNHVELQRSSSTVRPKKTYLQELSLWSGVPKESIWSILIRPLFMLGYPAVIWAFISYSISLACVVTVNSLNAFVFQEPPYNFSPGINGLVNIPALMGTLFGAFAGGYLTDVYSTWDARRHGGIFRPESRLVPLIIPAVLVPTGLLIFGFGATNHMHWAGLFVANGLINVGVTGVASIGMIYVSDSYYPVAAEALLLINGLKNVVAFGYTFGITPWIVSAGFEKPFGTVAGIFIAIMLSAIPLYFFGEKLRHNSATWKVICW